MSEFNKIICPTDFSKSSEYAMWYARAFAKGVRASIHCVNVFDNGALDVGVYGVYASGADMDSAMAKMKAESEKLLEHVITKAKLQGLEVDGEVRTGRPALEVVKAVEEMEADLIVLSTHGHTGLERVLFGSTCERIMRLSPVPVLSIKHPEEEFDQETHDTITIKKVLCPIDFSELSHQALARAVSVCREFNATLVLAHVVDMRMDYPSIAPSAIMNDSAHLIESSEGLLDKIAADIEGITVEKEVVTGIPHRELIRIIESQSVDMVVMTTHGRKGLAHALLGSVAEKLARLAPCPVLTVRPKE